MAEVRQGGLYRCCVETAEATVGQEGDILRCKYCGGSMIFVEGAWEWEFHYSSHKKEKQDEV